jgi:hypothetical protein
MSNNILKSTTSVTMPWEEAATVSKTVVVDSRQRNCAKFPSPSKYRINLGDTFKNINAIELKGAIIPKSSYNVHSSNNKIDFSIGDQVASIKILNGGAGYTSVPNVIIATPLNAGLNATATAYISVHGVITNIQITFSGSGYIPSRPPPVIIDPPQNKKQAVYPVVIANVGTCYNAALRVGEYEIGGNPTEPTTSTPTNLLLEIQDAMNHQVNGGNYVPNSTSPFAVRLVSQYPLLGAEIGTPESFNTNSCKFNRIQIVNVNSDTWELLWCTGKNNIETSAGILGFNTVDSGIGISVVPVMFGADVIIPGGTAIRGYFDYNLNNDPDYVILSIGAGERNLDRIKSLDGGIDDRFCVLLFDNNNPETLHDITSLTPGGTVDVGGIDYLQGPIGRGTFWRTPGAVKPLKAGDFDGAKKISFKPPLGKLSSLSISFTKFGYRPGSSPQYYNMEGREHLLLFELSATDNRSQMKD